MNDCLCFVIGSYNNDVIFEFDRAALNNNHRDAMRFRIVKGNKVQFDNVLYGHNSYSNILLQLIDIGRDI